MEKVLKNKGKSSQISAKERVKALFKIAEKFDLVWLKKIKF